MDLLKLNVTGLGALGQGERCYDEQYVPGGFNVIFLRQPRRHVLSLYIECKHGNWAGKTTRRWDVMHPEEPFPRELPVADSFDRWLDFFVRIDTPDYLGSVHEVELRQGPVENPWLADYQCYSPRNTATRQLAAGGGCPARQGDPHHVLASHARPGPEAVLSAVQRLGTFSFVGITDLYNLSYCLLLTRLRVDPLPEGCYDASVPVTSTFIRHGRADIRPDSGAAMANITSAMWEKVDKLSRHDQHLYVSAAWRMLGEAEAYQATAKRKLGGHLLNYTRFLESITYIPPKRRRSLPASFSL